MGFLPYNTQVILAGVSLLGISAGVIGVFALLRRRALLGDATAHAALPGLCLAFMIAEKSMPALLAGAFLAGLTGIGVLSALKRWTRLKEDAALALVLSVFYAIGVVLLSVILARWSGADRAGLGSFLLGTTTGMSLEDVFWLAGVALATLLIVGLLYKEMKLTAFDAQFAQVQGWPAAGLDYLLNVLVVLAVVVGLPAVGVVMIAAMLIMPAAAARFWSDRLTVLLMLAGAFGLVGAVGGTLVSAYAERYKLPAGPAIILATGSLFVTSLLFGFRHGLVARWRDQRRFHERLRCHQLLCDLHAMVTDRRSDRFFHADLQQVLHVAPSQCAYLAGEKILERQGEEWEVTAAGKNLAERAARRERQAKQYLEQHPELASSLTTWFLTEDVERVR